MEDWFGFYCCLAGVSCERRVRASSPRRCAVLWLLLLNLRDFSGGCGELDFNLTLEGAGLFLLEDMLLSEAGLQLRGLPELALIVWRHGLMQPFQAPSPESLPAPNPTWEPEGFCCSISLVTSVTSSPGTRHARQAATPEGECALQLHSSTTCKGFPNPAGWGALEFIP